MGHEEVLPRTCTNSHEHDTGHHQHAPSENQDPRASGIEDGADDNAAQESEEDVDAEDPSHRARAILRELMCEQIRVVRTDTVHVAVTS